MPNYGPDVSRTLPVGETAYVGSVHLKLKPSIDAEHNLDTDLADFNSAERLKALVFSGLMNERAAGEEQVFVPTNDPNFIANFGQNPNEFAVQNFDMKVNGWLVPVKESRVNGGSYLDSDYVSIELPPAPAPSPMFRQDFVFLEVWRSLIKPSPDTANKPDATHVYKYGNVQYGGTNPDDDLIQPDINATTSYRIQIQHRIRIAQGVNFADHPDGLSDPTVEPQGGAALPSSSWNYARSGSDTGLFIAGDGSASAQSDLNNVDGYVYAVPLFKIHRRNSSAYSLNNPNGSNSSILTSQVSDRPDGLFYDEVAVRDIIDLRHKVISGLSYSEMLEENFDALLRRDLFTEFGQDSAIDNQIQGTEMLTVDGFSLIDQTGVYDLPFDPDGLRRDYSGEARSHTTLFTFDATSDVTSGPILYNSTTREIQIALGAGTALSDPEIYTDGTLRVDGIPAGWTGSAPSSNFIGILNASYASDTVSIRIQSSYDPAGHRFVATRYYGVRNARALNPEDWSYTINPTAFTETRNIEDITLPSAGGVTDVITDHPIVTVSAAGVIGYPTPAATSPLSYRAQTRTYERHALGNGTNQYTIPNSIGGVPVYGVKSVQQSDVSVIAFAQVDPTSVTRNIDGSFTVILPSGYTATTVLKFELILGKTGTVLDRSTKGLKEIMNLEWLTQEVSVAGTTFDFFASNLPYGMCSYDKLGTDIFFAYIDGLRVDILEADVDASLNKITLTFSAPVTSGQTILFYALVGYSPALDDRIQITYDRLAYQGVGGEGALLEGARIVATGKYPLLHSLGTFRDTDERNKEMYSISEVLPLGFGMLDSDLSNADLSLSNSQYTSFKMLRLPYGLTHDYRVGNTGKLPVAGDVIALSDVLVEPARGIKNKALNLRNRLNDTDYPMEFVSPLLDATENHQVVMYYLVQTFETKELMMLVVTYTANSTGNALVKSSVAEAGVSYDLFKIKGKPILK